VVTFQAGLEVVGMVRIRGECDVLDRGSFVGSPFDEEPPRLPLEIVFGDLEQMRSDLLALLSQLA
jgi:hypothetical protein